MTNAPLSVQSFLVRRLCLRNLIVLSYFWWLTTFMYYLYELILLRRISGTVYTNMHYKRNIQALGSGKAALQPLRKGVSPTWRHGYTWVSVRGRGRAKRAKNVSSPAVLRDKPLVLLLLLFSDSHPRRLDCPWTLFRRCRREPRGEETQFYSAAVSQKTNFLVLLRYVRRSSVSRSVVSVYLRLDRFLVLKSHLLTRWSTSWGNLLPTTGRSWRWGGGRVSLLLLTRRCSFNAVLVGG